MVNEAESLGGTDDYESATAAELSVLRPEPVPSVATRRQRLYRWWQSFLSKLPRRLVQIASALAMFGGLAAPFVGYPLGFPLFFVGKHYLLRPADRSRPWWAEFITSMLDRWWPPPTTKV